MEYQSKINIQDNIQELVQNYKSTNLIFHENIEIYHNDFLRIITDFFEQARHSIKISIYSFKHKQLIKLIRQKALEGISIEIVTDYKHIGHLRSKLKNCDNIHITSCNEHFLSLHSKYIIVDDSQALILTGNLDKHIEANRDFILFVNNKSIVQGMLKIFDHDSHHPAFAECIINEEIIFDNLGLYWSNGSVDKKTKQYVEYWTNNVKNNDALADVGTTSIAHIKHINEAKQSIYIYMQVFTCFEIIKALLDASKRGVEIKIITQDLGPQNRLLMKFLFDLFKDSNIGFLVNNKLLPYIHTKVCIVDKKYAIIGSTNFSYASLHLNRELSIGIQGQSVELLLNIFNEDYKKLNDHITRYRKHSKRVEPMAVVNEKL
jgi:phosphatidylserine/phosphatidylglycerophosphate/cardiolipin synthase-like enzyme